MSLPYTVLLLFKSEFWFQILPQLETPGTADQKYNLAFQVVDSLPPSDPVQVKYWMVRKS